MVARMRDPNWPHSSRPESITIFYTNLAPLDIMEAEERRRMILDWVFGWLAWRGIEDYVHSDNCVDSGWLIAQLDYIRNGANQAQFAQRWGSVDAAYETFQDCFLQSMSLAVQSTEVILFVSARKTPHYALRHSDDAPRLSTTIQS